MLEGSYVVLGIEHWSVMCKVSALHDGLPWSYLSLLGVFLGMLATLRSKPRPEIALITSRSDPKVLNKG